MDDAKLSASAQRRVCKNCDIEGPARFRLDSHGVIIHIQKHCTDPAGRQPRTREPRPTTGAYADIDSLPLPSKLFFSQIWVLLFRLRVVDQFGNRGLSRNRNYEMRYVTKHRVLDNLDTDFGHRALMKHGHRLLGATVAAFTLGACAIVDSPAVEPSVTELQTDAVQQLATVPIPPVKPVPPPRESEGVPAGLAGVVGYDEDAVRDLLGDPIWVEEIPPALSWQYASDECVLRVLFFMEVTTRNFRVLSYDVTSDDDAIDVDQRCLSALVAQADDRRS